MIVPSVWPLRAGKAASGRRRWAGQPPAPRPCVRGATRGAGPAGASARLPCRRV